MSFLEHHHNDVMSRLAKVIDLDLIDENKLREFCASRITDSEVILSNNVKKVEYETTALKLLDLTMFSKKKPIITGYNTIFHNHDNVTNIPGQFLDFLLKERKVAKGTMFEHINDVDKTIYNSYETLQLILKLLANSYYGAFGMKAFHFFNVLMGPSVTAQGRQLITAAILGFEGFLGDNIDFFSFDEMVTFLMNIRNEECDDENVIDDAPDISINDLVERYTSKCKFQVLPEHIQYLEAFFDDISLSMTQKFYYKNRLFEFFKLDSMQEVVKDYFVRDDFPDVSHPPEDLQEPLDQVFEVLRYFVAYPYPIHNKTAVTNKLVRKVVIISDTDSSFLNIDPWVQFVKSTAGLKEVDKHLQVGITSVMTYFITKFIAEVFSIMCTNVNVPEREQPRINMKSEFHYNRVILTKNKKSYAGVILSKEGKVYDTPKFDIKGIQIKKVSTPKFARQFFSSVLEEQMLNAKAIDIKQIFIDYTNFESTVYKDVEACKTGFLKPGVLKSVSSYKMPYRQQGYRAVLVWNKLYPQLTINESSTFKILEFDKSFGTPEPISDTNKNGTPDLFWATVYENLGEDNGDKLRELFDEHPELQRFGLDVIAIPLNIDTYPEELLPIANTEFITSSVLSKGNILLESLGFIVIKSRKFQSVTNIVDI